MLSLQGCYSIQARKVFKIRLKTCYSDKVNLSENEKLDLNGYYLMYERGDFSYGPPNTPYYQNSDSSIRNVFFFKDGIYLENFRAKDDKPATIQNYFNNIYNGSSDTTALNYYNSWWGSYKITNDTIIAQFFFIGSLNAGWFGREYWFKIIDKQIIKPIYSIPIREGVSEEYLQKYWYNQDRYTTGKLVPLEKLPSSDCWLKKEKWFWCDESEWVEYMKNNGYKIKKRDLKK